MIRKSMKFKIKYWKNLYYSHKIINYLFYGCISLEKLPEISNWNTNKINNLNSIFKNCSSLTFIPNIQNGNFIMKLKFMIFLKDVIHFY